MSEKIRVIIADDSAFMRKKISEILNSDPDIEVIAALKNGKEAYEAVSSLKPDVVTLDVEMPVLNGIEALGYIMSECPTPCIMISAFTEEGAEETMRALEFGAVDFIAKPDREVISRDIEKASREIVEKVKLAAKVSRNRLRLLWPKKADEKSRGIKKESDMKKIFAIASSTGGTQALATVLPELEADFPAGVLVVQHMPGGFTKSLAERLAWQSKIKIVEAEDFMPIKSGEVIIAKGGMHMEVAGTCEMPYVTLNDKSPQLGVRPCANLMMESAAKIFKEKTVGIVLTGMGSDGTLGAQAIKLSGGYVLAEDASTCVVYGMPKTVIEAGLVDRIVPLHHITLEMKKLI